MNYQHLYHAGNHADVFKHLVLMALIYHLKQKEKPFCYIDTHAGFGEYDLTHSTIQEWKDGIGKLQKATIKNNVIKEYVSYQLFPGSPKVAANLIRPQDDIILIEQAEHAYHHLKKIFYAQKNIHIHQGDAYTLLPGLLPPKIKRGLILIDPPYEAPNEFDKLLFLLKTSLKKFATATYAVWYPIKSRNLINRFYQKLPNETLALEFCPWPDDIAIRLNGSGMIIINPPYQFEKTISPILEELIMHLKQDPKGFQKIYRLNT